MTEERQDEDVFPEGLALRPPVEQEDTPPSYANQVRVYGGTDAVIIEFYYMNHAKYFDAMRGVLTAPNTSRQGNMLQVRTVPVARVAIPLTSAADLITNVMSTVVGGAPTLQRLLSEWGERIAELLATVNSMAGQTGKPGSSQGGE
jgi:hypothetical protein